MRVLTGCLALMLTLILLSGVALAETTMTCDELRARLDELTDAADETTDPEELARIEAELDELGLEFGMRCMMGMPTMPVPIMPPSPQNMVRAATPEQEAKRRREIMNILWRQLQANPKSLQGGAGERFIPVPQAIPIKGRIDISGGFKSNPFRGWVWHDIAYKVTETFVGNLEVIHYFDVQTSSFTGKEEYSMHSISTGITVRELGGRKCLRATATLPGHCVDWQEFSRYRIDDGEIYPGAHSGVVSAATKNDLVRVSVDSPDILFRSVNGKATDRLGCFVGNKDFTGDEFKDLIHQSEIRYSMDVGSSSQATPGCRLGSTIELEIKILPE